MATKTSTRATLFVSVGEDPAPAMDKLRASILTGEFLAFDVETNALHPSDPRGRLTSIQVGSKHVAVLLDPDDPCHVAAAREILNDQQYRLTAHNAGFDILHLVRAGVFATIADGWARTTDTYILAVMLVQRNGGAADATFDLKALTRAWCGEAAASADAKEDLVALQKTMGTKGVSSGNWDAYKQIVTVHDDGTVSGDPRDRNTWAALKRDNPVFVTYCAADVFDSALLVEALDNIVRSLWSDRVDAEHRIARLVCEMTHRGMKLDIARTKRHLADAAKCRDEARALLESKGIPFSKSAQALTESPSDAAVAAAIRAEGIEVPRKRRSDGKFQPALDKRSLKKYTAAGSAVAPAFREWGKSSKEISTYYNHYLRTGGTRVHAEIKAAEAKTGRMAASSPNLQNVPEPVKPCLVADDGMVLISADFSSVEMRVAAAVTGDPELCRMYTDPLPPNATERQIRERDPYWLVAWQVWGPEATEDDRKLAKIMVLGNIYGGGAASLSPNLGIPVEEGEKILAGYRKRFPQLKNWWRMEMEPRIGHGVPSWTLSSGRFQSIDPTRAWAGFNLMIQGLARDLLLGAIFRCENAGLGENMLLPIHDEILFQVPEADAERLAPFIEQTMASVFQGVPITAEAKILGRAWAEKTHVKQPKSAA